MMRAASYTRTGAAEDVLEVGALPMPEPLAGEVLVRVMSSGINPADVKRRAGWNGMQMAHDLVIPHCDGAGVIEAVGKGVPLERIGERVWLWNAQGGYGEAGRAFGTAADYIALPSAQAVLLPDALSFEEGACLGVPALTAWLAVLGDGPVEGTTLLVQGGAGAVGQMCIQTALAQGAKVFATISSDAGAKAVAALGNTETIDRHVEDISARIAEATEGQGVDRIIEVDLASNMQTDISCLAPHGTIASYSCSSNPTPELPYYSFADLGASIRFVQGFRLPPKQRQEAEQTILDMIRKSQLRPQIGATFELEKIAQAHARVETGALGQTVLTLVSSERSQP